MTRRGGGRASGRASRLKVLIVLDFYFYYASTIANELARHCDVLVVTREHGVELGIQGCGEAAKRALLDPRVSIVFVRGRQRDPASLSSTVRAARAIRRFDPDVALVQDHSDWRLYCLQRTLSSRPVILTVHDVAPHLGSADTGNRVHRWVSRRLRSRADAYVVHGGRLVEQLVARDDYDKRKPVFSIPHGPVFSAVPPPCPLPNQPTVLFFGRIEYYKGLDIFIEAVERNAAAIPGLTAIIAGAGADAQRCRQRVTRPELFEWRDGFVPDRDLAELFCRSSALVLPYREASQSGVIPLAYAHGRPVIATRVGALPDAVWEHWTGLLVDHADAGEIGEAMRDLFGTPGLLEAMTRRAKAVIRDGELSSRNVAARHLEAFGSLLRS
jgi:glycosyltransferase involved in cell wall biosynthesis